MSYQIVLVYGNGYGNKNKKNKLLICAPYFLDIECKFALCMVLQYHFLLEK